MLHRKGSDEISGFWDIGTTIIGTLQSAGIFRIDGNFHGSIFTDDTLVIGRHACVHADIKVGVIEIAGQVFGNIDAKRSVEVLATGRVCGEIHTPVLVIGPGAVLDARISMAADRPEESSNAIIDRRL